MHGIQVTGDDHCSLECINMALWIGGPIVKLQVSRRSVGWRYEFGHDKLDEQMTRVMVSCQLCMVRMIIIVLVVVLQAIILLLHILYGSKNNINNRVGNVGVRAKVRVCIHVLGEILLWGSSRDGAVFWSYSCGWCFSGWSYKGKSWEQKKGERGWKDPFGVSRGY